MPSDRALGERLAVPAHLDGSAGPLRAPLSACTTAACTNYELIAAWRASKASEHTRRAYRKEAERFLL